MKTICMRLITLVLLGAGLNFVADAGIRIDQGKVFLVGRCTMSENYQRSVEAGSPSQLMVGIAQAEFVADPDGKPAFAVKKIITVRTDADGYYLVKNVPASFTYIFLGTQRSEEQSLQVKNITLVNACEKQGRVLDLGHHQIDCQETDATLVRVSLLRSDTIQQYMQHFIAKDSLSRFVHHVCNRSGYWGNGNALTSIDAGKLRLFGLDKAVWQRISAKS